MTAVELVPLQLHVEVWLLVLGVVALGFYATRVVGPKVVTDGPVVTRSQKRWFVAAVVMLWLASDWPVHDISEERLYSVHMVQHLFFTFVIPPALLLATPAWLVRLILGEGTIGRWLKRLARPLVAGILFNAAAALTHWALVVNTSVESGPFHYGIHTLIFATALLMWFPVAGPLPEMRLSLPGQMLYLFLMSVIPTIPAAWLTFAESVVYDAYDTPERLWGMSVVSDQQAAGLVMKLIGGGFLWVLILVFFFRWSAQYEAASRARRAGRRSRRATTADAPGADTNRTDHVLTWETVQGELREGRSRANGAFLNGAVKGFGE